VRESGGQRERERKRERKKTAAEEEVEAEIEIERIKNTQHLILCVQETL
jgi:hypothetical protein